jgi:hypothetical protein
MATDLQVRDVPRSRISLLVEAVVLAGACFLAFIWLVPAQTSEGGIGLSPAFLPKLCVAAIGLLIAADGVLRLVRRAPQPRYAEGWGAFFRLGVAACLGTLALHFGGIVGAVAVCCIATALALGERQLTYLVLPALFCTTLFWFVFR